MKLYIATALPPIGVGEAATQNQLKWAEKKKGKDKPQVIKQASLVSSLERCQAFLAEQAQQGMIPVSLRRYRR